MCSSDLVICFPVTIVGLLHNNALGIGLKMSQVKLPKIKVTLQGNIDRARTQNAEHCQINPSCLLSYLGIKGYANIGSGISAAVKKT